MEERVKRGNIRPSISSVDADFDQSSANAVLQIVAELLGVSLEA